MGATPYIFDWAVGDSVFVQAYKITGIVWSILVERTCVSYQVQWMDDGTLNSYYFPPEMLTKSDPPPVGFNNEDSHA